MVGNSQTILLIKCSKIVDGLELVRDPAVKRLIWFLLAGSRGGFNRGKIINLLKERPYNANQLASIIDIDYKAIQHHIKSLKRNNIITSEGDKYGTLYFLTQFFEAHIQIFDEIWDLIKEK